MMNTSSVNNWNIRPLNCHCVTNPVHGFPAARHQMLPSSYIDSHTTQTVACHPRLHFPSSIALITHTVATNQTHFISHGLPLSDRRVLFSIYRSPSDSYFTESIPCPSF